MPLMIAWDRVRFVYLSTDWGCVQWWMGVCMEETTGTFHRLANILHCTDFTGLCLYNYNNNNTNKNYY